jgi:CheY-like chemotaxis protein
MKILVADDEKGIRALFKTYFRNELLDSTVDVVVNGVETVDAFRAENYDVLLLDLNMPEKDGYQALIEIQEICRKEKRMMPFVIFCTGFTVPKEVEELITDKTHFSLLQKPVTYEQIATTFKTLM